MFLDFRDPVFSWGKQDRESFLTANAVCPKMGFPMLFQHGGETGFRRNLRSVNKYSIAGRQIVCVAACYAVLPECLTAPDPDVGQTCQPTFALKMAHQAGTMPEWEREIL